MKPRFVNRKLRFPGALDIKEKRELSESSLFVKEKSG
jgi:hypothetical protein